MWDSGYIDKVVGNTSDSIQSDERSFNVVEIEVMYYSAIFQGS